MPPMNLGLFLLVALVRHLTVRGQQVSLDSRCYNPGQDLKVTYSGADAMDDWIAFIPAASLDQSLIIEEGDFLAWAWKCGARPCSRTRGTVVVSNTLSPGKYVAVLVHDSSQGIYQGFANSRVLAVSTSCGHTPVEAPTKPQSDCNDEAANELANARSMIIGLIAEEADTAPQVLRLAFHDCLGGCDGCIDLTNPDNNGLDIPIDALEAVYEQHAHVVSRADIWALAATVAVEVVQSQSDAIEFPFRWWGRGDCTVQGTCVDSTGQSVKCTPKSGPHQELPNLLMNTAEVYHFFATELGLNVRETIVAMAGGHTVAALAVENSGIDGENGWVPDNQVLNNQYFEQVIGGNRPDAPIHVLVNGAPRWRRARDPDQGDLRNRRFWARFPTPNERIIMLNTDIGLFRDLNPSNYDDTIGLAECGFEDDTSREANIPVCPHIKDAVLIGAELKHDNVQFKVEFRDVLVKMVTIGYARVPCRDEVCKLSKR